MKNNMEARKVIFEQKQVHWFFFRLGVPYIDSYSIFLSIGLETSEAYLYLACVFSMQEWL